MCQYRFTSIMQFSLDNHSIVSDVLGQSSPTHDCFLPSTRMCFAAATMSIRGYVSASSTSLTHPGPSCQSNFRPAFLSSSWHRSLRTQYSTLCRCCWSPRGQGCGSWCWEACTVSRPPWTDVGCQSVPVETYLFFTFFRCSLYLT